MLVSGIAGGVNDYVFAPGQFAPNPFSLNKRISKTIPATTVVDSQALGKLYPSPVSLARFEADSGTTNRGNVRLELNAEGRMVERVYSNAVKAHPGAFDVVLDFSFQLGDDPEPTPEMVAQVAMSWEHAQALARVLGGLLEAYQENLGPLPDIEKARVKEEETA